MEERRIDRRQLRLRTDDEVQRLEDIATHFAAHSLAEGFRHGQRVLADLIRMTHGGCTLTMSDENGENERQALILAPADLDPVAVGKGCRRWTMATQPADDENAELISKWLEATTGAPVAMRIAHRGTILLMSEILSLVAGGWWLWSTEADETISVAVL